MNIFRILLQSLISDFNILSQFSIGMDFNTLNSIGRKLIFFSILQFPILIFGQNYNFCGIFPPHESSSSNPDSIIYDRFGNTYDMEYFEANVGQRSVCGYFDLDFSGIPDSLRGCICAVFEDISEIIEKRENYAPCGEYANSGNIHILVAYDPALKYPNLASGSPLYDPLDDRPACGEVQLNRANAKLNGGKSFFPSLYDGALFINQNDTFAHNLDKLIWHTDIDSIPIAGEFDLYSIVLHEALHILAFESRINGNGQAVEGYFSLWDNLIYTTPEYDPSISSENYQKLLVSNCIENCWNLNDETFSKVEDFQDAFLDNCSLTGNIDFVFGWGLAPILGGSLDLQAFSHLADTCNDVYINYVMQPGIKRGIESKRRTITEEELNILCLLGFKLESCDECYMVSGAEDLAKGVDYYNTCCNPVNISCVGDTSIIKFSDLLCNDFTNGSQIEISSYTSSSSNISVTTNDTAFVVYSTIQDEYEIHYTVKGCDCRLLSSVFNINVTPCTDCSQIDPCINLVCTDGFEEFNSSPHNQEGLLIELVGGNYWVHDGSQENTPDLCQYSGNNYLHIIGYAGNPEGIAFKLSRAVVPGCTLKINLDASHGNSGDVELNIHGSKFPPCAFEDSRISNDCMPRDCGDFIFNPICIDTRSVENGAGGSQACPPPNLDSIPEIEWPNLSGDSINYIIISPKFPPTGSKRVFIDNVVITASCIESCFSYNYVDGCNEVQLNPCLEEAELLHQWDFGDGDTSMMVSPSHLYTSTDTFLVTHVVIDGCDNSDTSTLTIIVNGENTECCPDTTISVSTTWDLTTILPGDGRFHTITVVQGVSLTIEDGLLLEFCEGGALQIEDGATVDLQGTLTSYGEMTWKGVYVQGDTSKGQHLDLYGNGFNGLQQGMFNSREGSMIKNAKAGVRNYGMQGYARAGGMIRCEGTTFVNNTIAVEFGPYQNINSSGQPVPSLGSFRDCTFYTDSNYYHHEPFFGFARLFKADGMRFAGCDFKNNFLPELPTTVGDFGFGIHAVSAGFEVYAIGSESGNSLCEYPCVVNDSSRFAGLGHGIYVMTQDKVRPYNVYQTIFENCCRGLSSIRTSGGTILFNTFKLGDVPDTDFSYGQIGLELHFDHDGFTIEENRFIASDEGEAIPIGLLCEGLGEFDNEIRRNTFVGVVIANQAFGVNRDNNIFLPRGLRYFCNDFEETPSHGYDFYIPKTPQEDLIHPFQTPGSSQGSNVSTGNHFAYTAQDFMNYGEGDINYCYYPPGNNEEPRDSFLFNIEKDLGLVNDCASNYCAPPCIEVIEDLKEDYFTHLDDFGVSHDNFTNVVVSENQLQIDSARSRALYYRRLSSLDAYLVVQHLRLDTLEYNTDSLIRWMGYLDTYGAEVMIAGEYASIGDFVSALDVLETLTARRDLSLAQAVDLTQLLEIYYLLEVKPLPSFTPQDRLFLRNIAYSNTGAASGVSRALLSSFGEYIPLPYYNGEQINFRNAVSDSIDIIDTSLFLADLFPLKIYPNPSNSDITIEWKYPEKICSFLVVYDFFGQKVLELNGEFKAPFKLETDDWKDGVHWIIVQDNEGFSHFGKVLIFRN